MTKIVISRGYGAGWSSWAGDKAKEIAEYAPIVEYVASGGPTLSGKPRGFISTDDYETTPWDVRESWLHDDFRPLVRQMMDELGLDYFFTGGADELVVVEVSGPYRVDEYDGAEFVTTAEDLWS